MDSRSGRHERRHERGRRLVHAFETFTSDELDRGEVELEEVPPTPEPEEEAAEPWGWGDKEMPSAPRRALAFYRERHPYQPDEDGEELTDGAE